MSSFIRPYIFIGLEIDRELNVLRLTSLSMERVRWNPKLSLTKVHSLHLNTKIFLILIPPKKILLPFLIPNSRMQHPSSPSRKRKYPLMPAYHPKLFTNPWIYQSVSPISPIPYSSRKGNKVQARKMMQYGIVELTIAGTGNSKNDFSQNW